MKSGLTRLAIAIGLMGAVIAQDRSIEYATLKRYVETGYPQDRLIEEIGRYAPMRLTDEQLRELEASGAGRELIEELRRSLVESSTEFIDDLVDRIERGEQETDTLEWILRRGEVGPIEFSDLDALVSAGASDDVLRAVNGQFTFEGYRTWSDPMGMLSIQIPAQWNVFDWWTGSGYQVLFTPEQYVEELNQFKTGFQIQVSYLAPDDPARSLGIAAAHSKQVNGLVRRNRSFELESLGDAEVTRLDGTEAIEQEFDVTMQGARCRERLARCVTDELSYFMEFVAPTGDYEDLGATRDRMLASFRMVPSAIEPERRKTPLEPQRAHETSRPAVVQVIAQYEGGSSGTGSGFIVREDGLVLTNAHVVSDSGVLASSLSVLVEDDGKQRRLEAKLVDVAHMSSPMIDLALLQLPRRRKDYPTLPVSRISSGRVMEGDPVIAIGFPGLAQGNMLVTRGELTAIKHQRIHIGEHSYERLDDLLTTATIAPGNSGGPCISLVTGGVIGLNTYRPVVGDQSYDYAGVCLIDHALDQFPQLRWYPRRGRVRAHHHLELGAMLLKAGKVEASRRELDRAREKIDELTEEQEAALYWQLALVASRMEEWPEFRDWRDKCLAANSTHLDASASRFESLLAAGSFGEALALLTEMERQRDDWWLRSNRARVHAKAGKYGSAFTTLDDAATEFPADAARIALSKARIFLEVKNTEKARDELNRALKIDPDLIEARIELASLYVQEGKPGAAQIEFHELVTRYPDDPQTHVARARFLRDGGDSADALDGMLRAIFLEWEAGGAMEPILEEAVALCGASDELIPTGIELANVLSASGEQWVDDANDALAAMWTNRGRDDLAQLHFASGGAYAGPLMTYEAFESLIGAGYSAELMASLLDSSSLGFNLEASSLAALFSDPSVDQSLLVALVGRFLLDQAEGSESLAGAVQLEFTSQVEFLQGYPVASIRLENQSARNSSGPGVALTSIVIRRSYLDESGSVLWSTEGPLVTRDPILRSGGAKELRFAFNSQDELEKKGIANRVATYRLEVISARNADYLDQLRISGQVTQGGYRVQIQNNSLFSIASVDLRCDFLISGSQAPVRDGAGQPFSAFEILERVQIEAGDQTEWILVPGWPTDVETLRRQGATPPVGQQVLIRPTVRDAGLALALS
ncbi:MAG: trypsin-like peptidase domain-containing protein [Planctomycetota bacterium]